MEKKMRGVNFSVVLTLILAVFFVPVIAGKSNIKTIDKIEQEKSLASVVQIRPKVITTEEIIISPSQTAFQGDTVRVEVRHPKELKDPYFLYKGKKIKLFKNSDGTYLGYLGLSAFEKTGSYKLSFCDSTGNLNNSKILNIKVKKYPVQNIVLSGKSGGITATKEELRRVQQAKDTVTSVAYWNKVPFTNPTPGCISSVYGLNRYYNGVPGTYHKGVDVKAPKGQTVVATAGGKVLIAKFFRLHGGTVAIDHGHGVVSMYLHLSKINVKEGEIVKEGQKIAEVGSTGISTGPHLHWGIYVNGVPVDPFIYWVKPVRKCS